MHESLPFLLPGKCSKPYNFHLQGLCVHKHQLPGLVELRDQEETHTRAEAVFSSGICHFRVSPVQAERGVAFYDGSLELRLVACEEDVRAGLQDERVICLEWIAPLQSKLA